MSRNRFNVDTLRHDIIMQVCIWNFSREICYAERAVLLSYVVSPSVCLSVTLLDCGHIH